MITCACRAIHTPSMTPYLPITATNRRRALGAYDAGAAWCTCTRAESGPTANPISARKRSRHS